MVEKPRFGQPCNGCGWCCTEEPCKLAQDALNCTSGPCIALEDEAGRKVCGLVKRPSWYMFGEDAPESETGWLSVMFANALGIGRGCDADDMPANEPLCIGQERKV